VKKKIAIFIFVAIVVVTFIVMATSPPKPVSGRPSRLLRFIGWTLEKPDKEKPTNADKIGRWLDTKEK